VSLANSKMAGLSRCVKAIGVVAETMQFESLTPMLRTWHIPATIDFYSRALGFTCDAGDAESGWASFRCNGVSLMLSNPNSHEEDTSPSFTGSLYFRVKDVDSLWSG